MIMLLTTKVECTVVITAFKKAIWSRDLTDKICDDLYNYNHL